MSTNLYLSSSSITPIEVAQGYINPAMVNIQVPLSDTIIEIQNTIPNFVPLAVKMYNSNTAPVVFTTQKGYGMPYVLQPNQMKSINITGIPNDTYILSVNQPSNSIVNIEFFNFRVSEYTEPLEAYVVGQGTSDVYITNQTVPVSINSTSVVQPVVIQNQATPILTQEAPYPTTTIPIVLTSSTVSYTNSYNISSTHICNIYNLEVGTGFNTYLANSSITVPISSVSNVNLYGVNSFTLLVVSSNTSTTTSNYYGLINYT